MMGPRQSSLHTPCAEKSPHTECAGSYCFRGLLMIAACAAVAHGCHAGGHGDADLLTHIVTAAGSSPAAARP